MDKKTSLRAFFCNLLILAFAVPAHAQTQNDGQGQGATAETERNYLRFIIDQSFGGLRIMELAAGTLEEVTGEVSPEDRTRPAPGFEEAVEPMATRPEIRSLARRDARVQRENILKAQQLLSEWYGETYQPASATPGMMAEIERLQGTSGENFDRQFLETVAHHHYMDIQRSIDCLSGYDLEHQPLRRFCQMIVNSELIEIDEMRDLACRHYNVCDLQAQVHNEVQAHEDGTGDGAGEGDAGNGGGADGGGADDGANM